MVEIRWHDDDALPFALAARQTRRRRASAVRRARQRRARRPRRHDPRGDGDSSARLGAAPDGRLFRPSLARRGVTQAQPYDDRPRAAAGRPPTRRASTRDAAIPAVALFAATASAGSRCASCSTATASRADFVVEMEEDGGPAALRRRRARPRARAGPSSPATLPGRHRPAGNVGAEALRARRHRRCRSSRVTNPLPAAGGADPEPIEQVRLYAPQAFRTPEARRHRGRLRGGRRAPPRGAAGGAPRGAGPAAGTRCSSPSTDAAAARSTTPFEARAAGVPGPLPAGRARPRDRRAALRAARPRADGLRRARATCAATSNEALSRSSRRRDLPGGRRGFFHPDNFTFGQPVYLSQIVAARDGRRRRRLASRSIRFQRCGEPAARRARGSDGSTSDRLEIARLDNDPSRPENGRSSSR